MAYKYGFNFLKKKDYPFYSKEILDNLSGLSPDGNCLFDADHVDDGSAEVSIIYNKHSLLSPYFIQWVDVHNQVTFIRVNFLSQFHQDIREKHCYLLDIEDER